MIILGGQKSCQMKGNINKWSMFSNVVLPEKEMCLLNTKSWGIFLFGVKYLHVELQIKEKSCF